jgi:hypothetical protein
MRDLNVQIVVDNSSHVDFSHSYIFLRPNCIQSLSIFLNMFLQFRTLTNSTCHVINLQTNFLNQTYLLSS